MQAQTIIPFLLLTIFAAYNNAEREAAMTALTAAADSTSFSADVNDLQSPCYPEFATQDLLTILVEV